MTACAITDNVTRVAVDAPPAAVADGKGHHTDIAIIMGPWRVMNPLPWILIVSSVYSRRRNARERLCRPRTSRSRLPKDDGMRFHNWQFAAA